MELPTCPICKEGRLLPFSDDDKPYAMWICTTPTCAYTIGRSMISLTYYKGLAAQTERDKGERHWTEFKL